MKEVLMAVDESISSTGVAIFETGELVTTYHIPTTAKPRTEQRYAEIADSFLEIINKHHPNIFVAEDVYQDNSILSFKYNLFLQGLLFGMGYVTNKKDRFWFASYYPPEWRKVLGILNNGKRKEMKERDIAYVKQKYGVDYQEDVADAICIGLAYIKEFTE